jgi:DNA polymerase
MGKAFRLTQHRGEFLVAEEVGLGAGAVLATVHPSSLLRMPDPTAREEGRRLFLKDFQLVAKRLDKMTG